MAIIVNIVVFLALALLFVAGLHAPMGQGRTRFLSRLIGPVVVLVVAVLANIVVYRNDQHFDLTHEEAFTPAPETLQILRDLKQDVELIYFYQQQNPAGRAAKQMVEIMGKVTPHLKVRVVDPDQQPALASQLGVRMYNAALLIAGERRIEVITTEDREIALGLLRLLRNDKRAYCFLTGHGEYDSDNFEFHTHFEGTQGHNHDELGTAVVQMEQHGIGRLRRAFDKLGYSSQKLNLATGTADGIPGACAAVIDANPRTPYAPQEVALLGRYLDGGGNLLMLLEPDYVPGAELTALLARAGVRVGDGVVVDPVSHYFTDEQMVAVEKYANHPATRGLAMSFLPGVRPLEVVHAPGVQSRVLLASSASATVALRGGKSSADTGGDKATRGLVIAAEGRLSATGKPFRLAVAGDADFASNSFYPYLANADLVLGLTSWLRGEQRGPAMKPPVEVLPMVVLNNSQMQMIFLICVVLLPGLCAALGFAVWWRRRY